MRKAILVGSAMIVLAAVVFAGNNDPWKAKPYQQWDEKDVRKILGDSPWSRIIQVDATWTNLKDIPAADSSELPGGSTTAPAAGGKLGTSPTAGANPTVGGAAAPPSDPGDPKPQVAFAVRWVSSRTLQRAAARSAELAGQIKPEEAEKQLANPPDVYEIALTGPDMRPFQTTDEDTLMKSAQLIDKKSKEKISPTKVQINRAADGKKVQAVAFIFPKKAGNGEPAIPEDEKSVDFVCNVNGAKIHLTFDVSKMQDNQGRDL
ncbi:MAG: hypothetical protein WCD49_16240 [Candidatus Acidiferrales bacterium]